MGCGFTAESQRACVEGLRHERVPTHEQERARRVLHVRSAVDYRCFALRAS